MCKSLFKNIKKIFSENKFGKNDNIDIGNNKNNKNIYKNSTVNDGDKYSYSLVNEIANMELEIMELKQKLYECKNCLDKASNEKIYHSKILNEYRKQDIKSLLSSGPIWISQEKNIKKELEIINLIEAWEYDISCDDHKNIAEKNRKKIIKLRSLKESLSVINKK